MAKSKFSESIRTLNNFRKWIGRDFAVPTPRAIRRSCLMRNSTKLAPWVETGTYLGGTTEFLASRAAFVHSIEPETTLFQNAEQKFASTSNVKILHGLSEDILPVLLPTLNGDLNFWLDGHYSAGETFQGPTDTPIVAELECIKKELPHLGRVSILIDDVRCFSSSSEENSSYPPLDFLVDWARKNSFSWHIEFDIFVLRNA